MRAAPPSTPAALREAALAASWIADGTALWRGVASGRWSVVDRFDARARRHAVLELREHDRRARLTRRESEVLLLAAHGASNKSIASDLHVSLGAASSYLGTALRKIGLSSRVELVALHEARQSARYFEHDGRACVVLSYPWSGRRWKILTRAEREVASLVSRGVANRAIATARGTSPNTVANQIKSLFVKLGVSSRLDLVRLLDE
jgi:DNA-binding NarL/FixJ family response regulator